MTAPHQTPAGWYADPDMVDTQRYWDGAQWSDQVRPMVDAPAVDASFAPAPGRPPAPSAPALIRKNTRGGTWGAAAILTLLALALLIPILGFIALVIAFGSSGSPDFYEDSDTAIEAVPVEPGGDHQFGEETTVFFTSSEGVGEDMWLIKVSTPRDVTASVLDDNPAVTTPSDLGYVAFDIEATLIETDDLTAAWFDMVVVGGATGREYWDAEPTAPCGQSPEQFVRQLPTERETPLTGKICVPVRVEDIGHPETRVELITPTGRAVFGS